MKILIISQYFWPDITAAAFRMSTLASFLCKKKGHEVTVLTSEPHKTRVEEGNAQQVDPEFNVFRVPIKGKKHLVQYAEFILKAGVKLRTLGPFDWVLMTSPPMFLFHLAKRMRGRARIFLDVRDLWPDSAVAAGKLKRGAVFRYFKRFELSMYRIADVISVVSAPMQEYVHQLVPEARTVIAYNGVPEADLHVKAPCVPLYKQAGRLKVFYFGNMGLVQGLEVVPRAMDTVGIRDAFEFHFVGDGAVKECLKSEVLDLQLDNVYFHDPMPRPQLLQFVREEADLLFLNLEPNWVFEKTIPSKVFDYLLLQKPVVSGIRGEGLDILKKTGALICFEAKDPVSLAGALSKSKARFSVLDRNAKENARNVVKDFSRDLQFEKIAQELDNA